MILSFPLRLDEKDGKIEVSRATADYNFTCFVGKKVFDSIDDVKDYIDEGHWDIGSGTT